MRARVARLDPDQTLRAISGSSEVRESNEAAKGGLAIATFRSKLTGTAPAAIRPTAPGEPRRAMAPPPPARGLLHGRIVLGRGAKGRRPNGGRRLGLPGKQSGTDHCNHHRDGKRKLTHPFLLWISSAARLGKTVRRRYCKGPTLSTRFWFEKASRPGGQATMGAARPAMPSMSAPAIPTP